jgi:sugar phosphate isomerase/epimerase
MKRFLVMAAAVACLCLTTRAAEESAAEKMGWKLALQCWTFNKLTFFETVDTAKKVGVKYVEAIPGQNMGGKVAAKIGPGMSAEAIEEMQAKLKEAGIKVVSFGVAGADKGTFEWAKKVGIETLVTEATEKDLPGIEKLCAEYGIKVALHNHPKPSHYWNPDTVLAGVKDLKLVGSCSDTGHWVRSGLVPVECLKKLEGHVVSLHFKDLHEASKNGHDVPWGTGIGDAKGQLAELKRQGFKGVISIEYEYSSGQQLIDNVAKCVEFFEATTKELAK